MDALDTNKACTDIAHRQFFTTPRSSKASGEHAASRSLNTIQSMEKFNVYM